MFTNISWQDYIIAVAITLTVYYVVIGLRYYSDELKALFSGKWRLKFRRAGSGFDEDDLSLIPSHRDNQDYPFEPAGQDEFAIVEELIGRLKETIATASKKKHVPQEFKHFLRLLLREYPAVRTSPFRDSVNELIVSECEKYGSVLLTEAEVNRLWNE